MGVVDNFVSGLHIPLRELHHQGHQQENITTSPDLRLSGLPGSAPFMGPGLPRGPSPASDPANDRDDDSAWVPCRDLGNSRNESCEVMP